MVIIERKFDSINEEVRELTGRMGNLLISLKQNIEKHGHSMGLREMYNR